MKMKKFSLMLLAAGASLTNVQAVEAQDQVSISIMGRVLPAWKLEAVAAQGDAGHAVVAAAESRQQVLVTIFRRGAIESPAGTVQLWLALRTNAQHYQLRATALSTSDELQLEFGQPQASGNGSQVAVASVPGFTPQTSVLIPAEAGAVATGTRISMRGTFDSPHNALMVPVTLHIPASGKGAGAAAQTYQVRFTMGE